MTDTTTQTPTTTSAGEQARGAAKQHNERAEFMVYFVIIFVATLPLAFITWALAAIRSRSLTDRGPVARAWSQARIITPMIFSA